MGGAVTPRARASRATSPLVKSLMVKRTCACRTVPQKLRTKYHCSNALTDCGYFVR